MDWIKYRDAGVNFVKKNRYVILVIAIGLALMAVPSRNHSADTPAETQPVATEPQVDAGQQLEDILSAIAGAGKVQVLLTEAKGTETIYQNDVDSDSGEETGSLRQDTVLITGSDRQEQGLVRQVNPPVYQGAIVICQGAENPSVRLAIVEAVSCVTGLGADRISVLKMK